LRLANSASSGFPYGGYHSVKQKTAA